MPDNFLRRKLFLAIKEDQWTVWAEIGYSGCMAIACFRVVVVLGVAGAVFMGHLKMAGFRITFQMAEGEKRIVYSAKELYFCGPW